MSAIDTTLRAMLEKTKEAVIDAEERIHQLRRDPASGELIGYAEPGQEWEVHADADELVLYQHSDAGSVEPIEIIPIYRGKSKFAVQYVVGDDNDQEHTVEIFEDINEAKKFAAGLK